ncbi:MAG: pilus assembly protein N-terminal domain-containing protein [Micavibrio sp.]
MKRIFYASLLCCAIMAGPATIHSAPVFAQSGGTSAPEQGLMPPVPAEMAAPPSLDSETHPVLNLMPDKSELVRLDREASSVIVGNPSHIAVLLDSPRLAVVVPRASGATHFTILDKDGNVIMQRHAVVAAPKKNYVRIRRSCNATQGGNSRTNRDCQPTSVYFCPDMCHEISDSAGDPPTGRR